VDLYTKIQLLYLSAMLILIAAERYFELLKESKVKGYLFEQQKLYSQVIGRVQRRGIGMEFEGSLAGFTVMVIAIAKEWTFKLA